MKLCFTALFLVAVEFLPAYQQQKALFSLFLHLSFILLLLPCMPALSIKRPRQGVAERQGCGPRKNGSHADGTRADDGDAREDVQRLAGEPRGSSD